MDIQTEHVLQQALQLPIVDRELLADQLYSSLHPSVESQEEIDAAWSTEIARRIEEVDNGQVTLIPAGEVHLENKNIIDRERPDS